MSESMPPNGNAGPNANGAPGAGGAGVGGPGVGAPGVGGPGGANVVQDDKTIAMLTHLSCLLLPVVMPLIVWILKKDTSPYLNDQAKEALNFQITIMIYHAIAFALAFVTSCIHMGLGFLLMPLVYAFGLVAAILAAIASSKGEYYRYPMCFRFVR